MLQKERTADETVGKQWRKISVPTRKGYFPYKLPLNLCNIYQFTTDIVTTNTTMRSNTCSFDKKKLCKKNVHCCL